MTVISITAPTAEPVSLAEAKTYLRVEGTDQDTLIQSHISAARQACEQYTGLLLMTQNVAVRLSRWPTAKKEVWWSGVKEGLTDDLQPALSVAPLPVAPVQALLGIDLLDEADATTAVTPTPAYVTSGLMPLLVLKSGSRWPQPLRNEDGLSIRLTVGFGTAAQVPFALREGILQLVAYRFDNPAMADTPTGVKSLWSSYRRIGRPN